VPTWQIYGSLFTIEIGDGQRDSFRPFVGDDDDELPGLGGLGQRRIRDFQQVRDVREVLAGYDLEHGAAP
jgi:hypothetical protein